MSEIVPPAGASLAERVGHERRARDLLQRVAVAVGSATDLPAVLQSTLDLVCAHTRWPVGHAYVLDGEALVSGRVWHVGDLARFRGFVDASDGITFAAGVGLPGRVLASGRASWITDVHRDDNFPRASSYVSSNIGAGFAFPARAGERVLAVLEFFSETETAPDEPLLEVMDTVGLLVGAAMERQRANAALSASELRFQAISQSANDAIVAADAEGRVTFWNAAAERTFGWTSDEMLGQQLDRIIPPRHRASHHAGMDRVRRTGKSRVAGSTVELSAIRKDGGEFPIELSIGSWTSGPERYFSAVLRDVTERHAAAARLREAADELARQNEALERSHAELLRSWQQVERIFSAYSEILPGTELDGRYRLEERIGAGGYGVVYRAHQLNLDRHVAVKLFRPASGRITPEHLTRFRLEAVSTCRVSHPNAVTVLDSGVSSDGLPYIVMELLSGRTLGTELRTQGRLRARRALAIVAAVCDALAAAHDSGIVHRDVKPENVFLHEGRDGEVVKILDFGIAKLVSDTPDTLDRALTATGRLVGTPTYMAPERLRGHVHDGRSDVYSAAVLLYELLSGRPPFQHGGAAPWDLVRQHVIVAPPPLDHLDPRIPPELAALVVAALAKEPTDRPSAAGMAAGLRELLDRVPDEPLTGAALTAGETLTMEFGDGPPTADGVSEAGGGASGGGASKADA